MDEQDPGAPAPLRHGRDGSQWYNARPTSDEFETWFTDKVKLHDGMEPGDWVGGIALLADTVSAREVVGFHSDGRPNVQIVEHEVLTPYAKYETRLAYFWAWMEKHPEWLGAIESVVVGEPNTAMPPGMKKMRIEVPGAEGVQQQDFIVCTKRVRIYERASVKMDGRRIVGGIILHDFPEASKQQPVFDRYGNIDQSAVQKAESGAIGRALGFAGVLVLPGGGAGTAEEAIDARGAAAAAAAPQRRSAPQPPADPAGPSAVAAAGGQPTAIMVAALIDEAKGIVSEQEFAKFTAWYTTDRSFPQLAELSDRDLVAVERKLRKMMDEAGHRS